MRPNGLSSAVSNIDSATVGRAPLAARRWACRRHEYDDGRGLVVVLMTVAPLPNGCGSHTIKR